MTRFARRGTVVMALLLAGASAGWCQQYLLYTPSAVNAGQPVDKKDGVLVQEVQIQKGDTLYGLSRKFNTHGSYYPQILLFNSIQDPNKIYTGDVVRIPVTRKDQGDAGETRHVEKRASAPAKTTAPAQTSRKEAKPAAAGPAAIELSTSELKKTDSARDRKREAKKKTTDAVAKKADSVEKSPAAPATGRYVTKVVSEPAKSAKTEANASQKLFEQGVKAYRQEDYRSAVELFDRFLNENPSSPLAPDASLYKAECYLKQSGQ